MLSVSKCLVPCAASILLSFGCGAPSSPTTNSQESPKTSSSPANAIVEASRDEVPKNPVEDPTVKAEIDNVPTGDLTPTEIDQSGSNEKKIAEVQVTPSTAKEAIAAIHLSTFPKIKEKSTLQSGPTYLYYSSLSTLAEADSFYKTSLQSQGWKEIPPLTPPTEQYIDRLFEKSGYVVRASLSLGGDRSELSIMLANLGNIDLRSLPRLNDAEVVGLLSNPVNITYKTTQSIADAADSVHQKLTATGWQPWSEFQQSPIDVPHYRNLHYRKEACRLNVGVLKNPQDPNDKTTVFYIAEFVTPFDIPMADPSRTLKLDLQGGRASFESSNSRKDLVSILQANSEKFGWKLTPPGKFESGEQHLLPIDVDSGAYLVARLVESLGKYSVSIESYNSPPKTADASIESIAKSESVPEGASAPTSKGSPLDDLESQITAKIQSEIANALGSLGNSPTQPLKDVKELQAMSEQLLAKLGASNDSSSELKAEKEVTENPFDVPADTTSPPAALRAIDKSIGILKFDNESFELRYSACYVMKEYGRATKCILFSDSPVDAEKLKRMLLKEGQPVHGSYVSENSKALIDIRVSEGSVSLNAQIGGSSIGISSSEIQSNLFFDQKRLIGVVGTKMPIEVGQHTLEFNVKLNQDVIQVDWTKRGSPEATKLVADESKDYLIPEGCGGTSSEGSRYRKKIEATIDAPLSMVRTFYDEQLPIKGWKTARSESKDYQRFLRNEQELLIKLESIDGSTKINLLSRDLAAARSDGMLPPAGKAMLVLGNLSDSTVGMSIGGKTYKVTPSAANDPKSATKVIVDPGTTQIRVSVEQGKQKYNMEANVIANSTWGVLFDTSFQDVLRLY